MGLDKFSTSLHSTAVIGGNYSYYLLSRRGEIENWITTERSLGSVELSLVGRCDQGSTFVQKIMKHPIAPKMSRFSEEIGGSPSIHRRIC